MEPGYEKESEDFKYSSSERDEVASNASSNYQENDEIDEYDSTRRFRSKIITPFTYVQPILPLAVENRYKTRALDAELSNRELFEIHNQRQELNRNTDLMLRQAQLDTMVVVETNRRILNKQTDDYRTSLDVDRSKRLQELQIIDSVRNTEFIRASMKTLALQTQETMIQDKLKDAKEQRREDNLAMERKYLDERSDHLKQVAYSNEMELKHQENRNLLAAADAGRMTGIMTNAMHERNQIEAERLASRRRNAEMTNQQRQEHLNKLERTLTDREQERQRNREANLQNEEMIRTNAANDRQSFYTAEVEQRHSTRQATLEMENVYNRRK